MLAMDELLCELIGEEKNEQGLPPGFRFHPTDEELITFYLASKVFNGTFCGVEIAEVDLNRCEPWELPDVAKMGEKEWYFFSLRDRKYPTGLRTNRATGAGYWKATGKDREVYSASSGGLLGMKKTLVFYKGRAPRGEKTKWVMHEYRLDGDFSYRHTCKEEWVICRIFHKNGEKKNAEFQGQGFFMDSSLPSLLEVTPSAFQGSSLQNPFNAIQQENDLKTLLLNYNGFQPTFPADSSSMGINTEATKQNFDSDPSPSMLLKSLMWHQDWNLKEQSSVSFAQIAHCKTEANFCSSQFQFAHDGDNLISWVDKIQPNTPYSYPFDMDCGISAATTNDSDITTSAHEMSTSNVAFLNMVGSLMSS